MHEQIKKERFQDLVNNPGVFAFARRVLTDSYTDCVPGFEDAMQSLLQEAFDSLSAAGDNQDRFNHTIITLRDDVFRKQEPSFWFNRLYKRYKRELKPQYRFRNLQDWLSGKQVLDLGCGDGLTSLVLSQQGFKVYLTDVLDYRDPAAKSLPFAPMTDSQTIPFRGKCFDMGIVFAVLHHVEAEDLVPLLDTLHQTCRQLIIEEDCYAIPAELDGLPQVLDRDEQLRAFVALPLEEQLRYLMFVDYFANAITQGLPEMDMPFNFRTVREWHELFADRGFCVQETRVMGFQKGFFNRSSHVWFLLEANCSGIESGL